MLFLKKDNSWSMMHMVAWALHDVFRQALDTVLLSRKTINKEIIKTKGFNFSEMEIKPGSKSFENL